MREAFLTLCAGAMAMKRRAINWVGLPIAIALCAVSCAVGEGAGFAQDRGLHIQNRIASLPAGRTPGTSEHLEAQQVIVDFLRADGMEPQVMPFTWPDLEGASFANIEVRQEGTHAMSPIILVTAHYDSVRHSPGADDNGSGVMIAMDVAKRLSTRKLHAEVRFVWLDGEEIGILGAQDYLLGLSDEEKSRILGVINLECVGYVARGPQSQSAPAGSRLLFDPGDIGDFLLVISNVESAFLAEVVERGMNSSGPSGYRTEVFDTIPGKGWILPDVRRSDHARFWDAEIPAIMLTDTANFRNAHYHRSTDLAITLDPRFLEYVAQGVEAALLELAGGAGD